MILLALVGIIGMVMVLVVVFCLLTVAKQSEEDLWRLTGILEDGRYEDQQTIVVKGQMPRPAEKLNKNGLKIVHRASV